MRYQGLVAFAFTLVLAGCGGGGGGSVPSAGVGSSAGAPSQSGSGNGGSNTGSGSGTSSSGKGTGAAPQAVAVQIHIPGTSTTGSATKRRAQFVAANTAGVLVQVYAASDTARANLLGSSATNVAPGSSACNPTSGPRTCIVNIPAPPGNDLFIFTTYDQAPNPGTTTFPGNANILASGTKTQTISSSTANQVNVTLGGALAYITPFPLGYNLPAGFGAQSYTLEMQAFDAANDAIIGTYYDANGNPDPVTVTETEIGGSGLTKISVGSNAPGTTATVNASSDLITVAYTGGGLPGYGVTFAPLAANGATVTPPPNFAPVYLTSSSPYFSFATSGTNPAATLNFTAANQSAQLTVSAQNLTFNFLTVDPGNCANVLTFSTPSTGSSETFTASESSVGGSCEFFLDFPFDFYGIDVNAVGNTTGSVNVAGNTLAYLAEGTSGVKIRDAAGTLLGSITTSPEADFIGMDDHGDVFAITLPPGSFFSPTGPGSIALYKPTGSGFPPAYTASSNIYTPTDPTHLTYVYVDGAGDMVANELNEQYPSGSSTAWKNTFDVWLAGHTGAPSYTISRIDAGPNVGFGWMDHGGNLVVPYSVSCASGTSWCVKYDIIAVATNTLERTYSETHLTPQQQASFTPNYFGLAPNGTLYVTEYDFSYPDPLGGLYIYAPGGNETTSPIYGTSAGQGLDFDATGNVYLLSDNAQFDYVNNVNDPDTFHTLVEMSPDGQTSLRSITEAGNCPDIAVAADGTAFFSQYPTFGYPGATYSLGANSSSPVQIDPIGASNIVLYDGTQATLSTKRAPLSVGSGSAHGGGMHVAIPLQYLRARPSR